MIIKLKKLALISMIEFKRVTYVHYHKEIVKLSAMSLVGEFVSCCCKVRRFATLIPYPCIPRSTALKYGFHAAKHGSKCWHSSPLVLCSPQLFAGTVVEMDSVPAPTCVPVPVDKYLRPVEQNQVRSLSRATFAEFSVNTWATDRCPPQRRYRLVIVLTNQAFVKFWTKTILVP